MSAEREILMKKLVEVELDGQAAAKQVAALRDVIRRMREVRVKLISWLRQLTNLKYLIAIVKMERVNDN